MADDTADRVGELIGRLENYKFSQAKSHVYDIPDMPRDIRNGVRVLHLVFGDCGWFSGPMADIVGWAVIGLISKLEKRCPACVVVDTSDGEVAREEEPVPARA